MFSCSPILALLARSFVFLCLLNAYLSCITTEITDEDDLDTPFLLLSYWNGRLPVVG